MPPLIADCRRIHTLCLPDPRPDADAAPRRTRRLPRPPPVLAHAGHVGSKGFHPRTRRTAACLPRARRPAMVEANQHTSVLGIVQQRLVPSKANDSWGFELLSERRVTYPSVRVSSSCHHDGAN